MKDTNDFINFIKTRKFQTMWSWPYMTLVLSTPTFLKKKELTLSAAITKITVTRKYLSRFKQMERRSLKNSVLQQDSNPLPMGVFIAQLVEHPHRYPGFESC